MRALIFDKEPAYVLHRQPYQENTQLVQFLTPGYGHIMVLVRQSSKMIGKTLQPFTPMLLSCAKGGDLFTLRELDVQGRNSLEGNELKILGMYINELVVKLVPKYTASRSLFRLYAEALLDLTQHKGHESVLRRFELGLLEASGHGMQLEHDVETYKRIETQCVYTYEPGSGPLFSHAVECRESFQAKSGRDTDRLLTCHGKTLLALKQGLRDYDQQILDESRRLMRAVVTYHLRGKDMKTRSIFQYLKSLT